MKKVVLLSVILVLSLTACSGVQDQDATIPSVDTGIDPYLWVIVPKGPFLLGQHEVKTDVDYDYEIMVTDVTNAQYAAFVNTALATGSLKVSGESIVGTYPGDTFHGQKHEVEITAGDWSFIPLVDPAMRLAYDGAAFSPKPGFENHPMTGVSWFGAWGYCEFNSWRLPTDIEWEKAARGPDNRPYPWGHEINPRHANFVSSHDIFERTFSGAGGTTPVGFYNGQTHLGFETHDSASPYGVYDMAGNVWQWIGDIRTGVHYRNLRGGSHTNYAYNLRIWTHNNADPIHFSANVGFRCVKDE